MCFSAEDDRPDNATTQSRQLYYSVISRKAAPLKQRERERERERKVAETRAL
jgi:hypothetical protein